MSISLPQELKTQKLKSLKGDARKLAEELLAEKFDIKEEVVPERDPFRGQATGICQCSNPAFLQCNVHGIKPSMGMGPNGYNSFTTSFQGQRRAFSTYVSSPHVIENSIRQLIRDADSQNMRHEGRVIHMSREMWDVFRHQTNIMYGHGMAEGVLPRIYGCDVEVASFGYNPQTIELRCFY